MQEKIKYLAKRQGLDPYLILAMCKVESSFEPNSARYEPENGLFVKPLEFAKRQGFTADTERAFQSTSWGLMHIMGYNARALGYKGFLPALCDAETGLFWAMQHFRNACMRYDKINDQISTYNHGHPVENSPYTKKVLKALEEVQIY